MKKYLYSLFVIIVAMVALSGCSKPEVDEPVTSEARTVNFFANSVETKTEFGDPNEGVYPTLWTKTAKVKVALNYETRQDAVVTPSDDRKTASFATSFANVEAGSYIFAALSPSSAANGDGVYLSNESGMISVNIWADQTPQSKSVDEKAQVLYAVSDEYNEFPENVALKFHHLTAYGKLSFSNLNLNGANVKSVSITSSVNIAGRWNYNLKTEEYIENSGSKTITLTTTATENLWFACAPADLNGQTLTFTVNTDKGTFTREVTFTGDKYKFDAGTIATMTVNMATAEYEEPKVYELVKDVMDLTEGSKVVIAAANSNYAISTTQNNNNRAQAAQTKTGDKLSPVDGVEIFEIEPGSSNETYSLKATITEGYIYAAGGNSSNYLRTKAEKDLVSSWKITISDAGVASIVCADNSVGKNTLQYNSSNSLFSCYASGQSDVAIYKLQGSGKVLENYLRVSSEVIEVDAEATTASFVVKSDLEWNASSDDVVVTKENNTVKVIFPANETSEEKVYTITVSAAGVADVIVTITQAAKKAAGEASTYVFVAGDLNPDVSFNNGTVNGLLAYKLGSSSKTGTLTFPADYSEITFYGVGWTSGTNKLTVTNGAINNQSSVTLQNDNIASGTINNNFVKNGVFDDTYKYTIKVSDTSKNVILSLKRGIVWGFEGVPAN